MPINETAQMGYGEADITPEGSAAMVGFFRPDNRSKGVLHPLKLQTLVFKSGRSTSCLMAIDSLGFTTALGGILREKVADVLGTSPQRVMLCFSHTHAAPNAAEEPAYFAQVCEKAAQSAKAAAATLAPTWVGWGIGENTIGLNRRNEPENMDCRLGITKLVDARTKKLKALLLRVTAHANILSSDNYLLSPDYFGAARELLEKRYGCKVILTQGAAGDIRPKYHQDNTEYLEVHCFEAAKKGFSADYQKVYTAQSRQALEKTAASIAASVGSVLENIVASPTLLADIDSHTFHASADVPSPVQAEAIAKEAVREAGIDPGPWLKEVKRLQRAGVTEQCTEIEIQYCFLGEGCLCGVANEAMCKIALEIEETAGTPLLFFGGYTGGCNSYLPTAKEFDKGGYEVLWSNLVYFPYHGRVMPLRRETAGTLVQEVVRGWRELKERLTCPAYGDQR